MRLKHQRQIIREAVKAALWQATPAQDRVTSGRWLPYRPKEIPAVSIFTLNEPIAEGSGQTAPRELERNLQLVVEAVVGLSPGLDKLDDVMDDMALRIERAMHKDPTFGDAASDSILSNTELSLVTKSEDGKALASPLGHLVLTYAVTYFTNAPEADDSPLNDFQTVDVRTSLSGAVVPGNQPEDVIRLGGT